MEAENKTSKIHPLFAAAAIALIVACLAGIASMMGILPNFSKSTANAPVAIPASGVVDAVPTPTPVTPVAAAKEPAAPEAAQVVKKPVHKKVTPKPVQTPAESTADYSPKYPKHASAPPPCPNCGVVESVQGIQQEGQASGLGAGVGAILGGVLGHQVGGGNGRTLATVAGAVGGGLAGNAVEKNTHRTTSYEVIVRMENGERQRFVMNEQRFQSGDPVQVINGRLSARY